MAGTAGKPPLGEAVKAGACAIATCVVGAAAGTAALFDAVTAGAGDEV